MTDEGFNPFESSAFEDLAGDASRREGDEPLELPLEMFFAEDQGSPEAVRQASSLEAGVLDRVGRERGFVTRKQRGLIRAWRGVLGAGVVCVLVAAAVGDRLGVAPWSEPAGVGPVSGLVESAAAGTAAPFERVIELRDGLMRVRVIQTPAPEPDEHESWREQPVQAVALVREAPVACPYLTAQEPWSSETTETSTLIRFEDGFSMPARFGQVAGGSPSESSGGVLRWPGTGDLTSGIVLLDGLPSAGVPSGLSPAWCQPDGSGTPR